MTVNSRLVAIHIRWSMAVRGKAAPTNNWETDRET